MAISESLFGDPEDRGEAPPRTLPARPAPDIVEQLAQAIGDLYIVQDSQQLGRMIANRPMTAIVFRGRLLQDAEHAYPVITERLKPMGFTPMMERRGEVDILIALEGVIRTRTVSSPVWLHVLLLVITIITTTLSGAQFQGYRVDIVLNEIFQRGNLSYIWTTIQAGAPFAFTLLLILGVHEMGHYLAARRHGVDVTLPYFIPFPLIGILGTLGAVIFIKSPLTNRKQLFDVGISGPLAGFVVALVAFIIGLFLTPSDRPNMAFFMAFGNERLGMPLLLQGLGDVLRPDIMNLSRFVARQPVALAAWFGMLLTVLNLLPIGQLDGGHVMYTLFGRAAWTIALVVFSMMLFLGLSGIFPSLIFFALLALLTGLRHPPPGNDITVLDPRRKAIGYATIVLFFLIGTATPFVIGPR
jgi:Zn-dependent protease